MKKLLAVILALVMALSISVQTIASAKEKDEFYPIIIVPGYSASALYVEQADGSQEQVWGLNMELIIKRVLARSFDLALGIKDLTKGDAKRIGDTVGEEFVKMFEGLRCNPDGTSTYTVKTYYNTAEECQNSNLIANGHPEYPFEPEIMAMFGETIGEDWNDYIYNFNCDFRMSVTDCAAKLNEFIDDVLEYSGAEKVNLYCVSHGGQVGSTFLNLYGKEKADKINNVILTIPAIGGAGIAYDFFSADFDFGEENLMRFIEDGMMFEADLLHWLTAEENWDFLDWLLSALLPYFNEIMGYWGSMWDFIPAEKYEAMKAKHLDSVKSAALIKKSDYFHNEVYPDMWTKLQDCIDNGINTYIVAGYGTNDIAGANMNGDAIIPTASSTGAKVAEWGKRFNDGYTTVNTKCKDSTHHHLSPDMEVDSSAGYLPEQTWYVKGLYHGMTIKSDYTSELVTKLMFTNELISVHDYAEFPQFHAHTNRCQTVSAYFDNSAEGYVSSKDGKLIIENCSKKFNLRLVSISCDGMDLDFEKVFMKKVGVGEKIEIDFTGSVPETSNTLAHVTVNCIEVGSATPFQTRTLDFTVLNGEKPVFDAANPLVSNAPVYEDFVGFLITNINSVALQKIIIRTYKVLSAFILNVF